MCGGCWTSGDGGGRMSDPRDRRRARRVELRWTLSYRIDGTQRSGTSLVKNFSAEGVRFVAEHPLEPGARLEVTLSLPDRREPIRFVGEVVWSAVSHAGDRAVAHGSHEVGVQFVQIDPKERALLMQYAMLYGPPEA